MNEKIKELAEQTGIYMIPNSKPISIGGSVADLEKFAELIVRECMLQCAKVEDDDELSDYEGGFKDGALLCYQEIKEHFGIK